MLGLQKDQPKPPSDSLFYNKDDGRLSEENDEFELILDVKKWPTVALDYLWYKGQTPGWGREKFRSLLSNWLYLGAKRIVIPHAKGSPKKAEQWCGYYVWPRYGFEGKAHWMTVRYWDRQDLATVARRSLLSLFSIPEGREQWRKFGGPLRNMVFDLTPGSPNLQAWREYAGPEIPRA